MGCSCAPEVIENDSPNLKQESNSPEVKENNQQKELNNNAKKIDENNSKYSNDNRNKENNLGNTDKNDKISNNNIFNGKYLDFENNITNKHFFDSIKTNLTNNVLNNNNNNIIINENCSENINKDNIFINPTNHSKSDNINNNIQSNNNINCNNNNIQENINYYGNNNNNFINSINNGNKNVPINYGMQNNNNINFINNNNINYNNNNLVNANFCGINNNNTNFINSIQNSNNAIINSNFQGNNNINFNNMNNNNFINYNNNINCNNNNINNNILNNYYLNPKINNNNNLNIIKYNFNSIKPNNLQKDETILIGLNNIGATCYMNSTLQSLSNTNELTEYFLNEYELDESNNEKKMSNEYYKLIKNLWNKDNNKKPFSPNEFKEVLSELNPLFKGIAANDSKDLVNFLLQRIHSELNVIKNENNPNNIDFNNSIFEQINRNVVLQKFFIEYNMNYNSIISKLFYGIFETQSKCFGCQIIKYNFQVFNYIEFPLEKVNQYCFRNGKRNNFNFIQNNNVNPDIDIYECFEYYSIIETMSGDNQMYCNICKKNLDSYYLFQKY